MQQLLQPETMTMRVTAHAPENAAAALMQDAPTGMKVHAAEAVSIVRKVHAVTEAFRVREVQAPCQRE